MEKEITILGIESSCDETAAAVVVSGRKVLSNEISSQIDIHTLYGGVVPEIASRKHVERINQVIREALRRAFGSGRHRSDLWAGPCGRASRGGICGEGNQLCQRHPAHRRPPYRRTYQRELHRGA